MIPNIPNNRASITIDVGVFFMMVYYMVIFSKEMMKNGPVFTMDSQQHETFIPSVIIIY